MPTQAQQIQTGDQMANWVYKPGSTLPQGLINDGWIKIRDVDGRGTGFEAVILQNTTTGNYHMAVAGTNEVADVKVWHSAVFGYEANKAQIDVALGAMKQLNDQAILEGRSVSTSGHSLAGMFTDIGSWLFGWASTKFDAVGASSVVNSSGFITTVSGRGITPVTS